MAKTLSILLGIVLLVVALVCFSSENMWAACIGTACLLFAVISIKYGDEDTSRGKAGHTTE